jgi:hypothetical protein
MTKKLTILTTVAYLTIATAQAGWIYLVPSFDVFGYRDRSGVLHAFQADQARFDQRMRIYQAQIHGRWLTVGEDVCQLNR